MRLRAATDFVTLGPMGMLVKRVWQDKHEAAVRSLFEPLKARGGSALEAVEVSGVEDRRVPVAAAAGGVR